MGCVGLSSPARNWRAIVVYVCSQQGDAIHVFPLHRHIVHALDAGNSICSQKRQPSARALKVLALPEFLRRDKLLPILTVELVRGGRPEPLLPPLRVNERQLPHVRVQVVDGRHTTRPRRGIGGQGSFAVTSACKDSGRPISLQIQRQRHLGAHRRTVSGDPLRRLQRSISTTSSVPSAQRSSARIRSRRQVEGSTCVSAAASACDFPTINVTTRWPTRIVSMARCRLMPSCRRRRLSRRQCRAGRAPQSLACKEGGQQQASDQPPGSTGRPGRYRNCSAEICFHHGVLLSNQPLSGKGGPISPPRPCLRP